MLVGGRVGGLGASSFVFPWGAGELGVPYKKKWRESVEQLVLAVLVDSGCLYVPTVLYRGTFLPHLRVRFPLLVAGPIPRCD